MRQRKLDSAPAEKFIPDSDREFAQMASAFASYVSNHPERFFLGETDVMRINRAVDAFCKAYMGTAQLHTRNRDKVCRKEHARREAEQIIREYANLFRPNKAISSVDKQVLRINERPAVLYRRPVPK